MSLMTTSVSTKDREIMNLTNVKNADVGWWQQECEDGYGNEYMGKKDRYRDGREEIQRVSKAWD